MNRSLLKGDRTDILKIEGSTPNEIIEIWLPLFAISGLAIFYLAITKLPIDFLKSQVEEQQRYLNVIIPLLLTVTFTIVVIKLAVGKDKKKAYWEMGSIFTFSIIYYVLSRLIGYESSGDSLNNVSRLEEFNKAAWPLILFLGVAVIVCDSLIFFIRRKRPDFFPEYGEPSRYHKLLSKFFPLSK